MKTVKRLRDNISQSEMKHLINYTNSDVSLRPLRKQRLILSFQLLHALALRANELTQITNAKMVELLEQGQTKIVAHKQKMEKVIYLTPRAKKTIKALLPNLQANNDYILVSGRGSKQTPLEPSSVLRDLNSYLSKVFPTKNITSHSFRASLVSELINDKNISVKVVQQLVGHKDISTTYLYAKVSTENIMNSLTMVR